MRRPVAWPWSRSVGDRVERLHSGDAASLAAIHAEGFAQPWSADDFEQMLTDPGILGDGIRQGAGRPVAFVLSRYVLDEAEILTIAVQRRMRGQGLGRVLLLSHLAGLAALGVRTLHLEVEEGNDPAVSLYQRLGFAQIGRRPSYYRRRDGAPAAAILMSRPLT